LLGFKVVYFSVYLYLALHTYLGKLNKSIFSKEVGLCIAFFIDVISFASKFSGSSNFGI
jgi:hypothetical protein